ncbi:hypothetical protein I8Y06_003281 [Photobacterium damselae]|nr:hypothetical protein [Photobacterium damselae]
MKELFHFGSWTFSIVPPTPEEAFGIIVIGLIVCAILFHLFEAIARSIILLAKNHNLFNISIQLFSHSMGNAVSKKIQCLTLKTIYSPVPFSLRDEETFMIPAYARKQENICYPFTEQSKRFK